MDASIGVFLCRFYVGYEINQLIKTSDFESFLEEYLQMKAWVIFKTVSYHKFEMTVTLLIKVLLNKNYV